MHTLLPLMKILTALPMMPMPETKQPSAAPEKRRVGGHLRDEEFFAYVEGQALVLMCILAYFSIPGFFHARPYAGFCCPPQNVPSPWIKIKRSDADTHDNTRCHEVNLADSQFCGLLGREGLSLPGSMLRDTLLEIRTERSTGEPDAIRDV